MADHYIKQIWHEAWDTHQVKVAKKGGNKCLFDFLKPYKLERANKESKYKSPAARFYRMHFNEHLMGRKCTKNPPSIKPDNIIDNATDTVTKAFDKLLK